MPEHAGDDSNAKFSHKIIRYRFFGHGSRIQKNKQGSVFMFKFLEGKQVDEYFLKNPGSVGKLKGIEYHCRCRNGFEKRALKVDDITFITFERYRLEIGVFAWYFQRGRPYFIKLE